MITVTHATYVDDFRIRIVLSDGTNGIADFRGRLDGPIFEPLNDPQYLASFELTEHTLQWENGADFAPEYLRDLIHQTESATDAMQRSRGAGQL
ncbi:MAG: DUF2442 domain-containing protein [Pirellulaceae bacterium]|jgi:hypothetical protein|nr:DUF2442 domain-containing protein [Pirellulaceae bacterium]